MLFQVVTLADCFLLYHLSHHRYVCVTDDLAAIILFA